MSSCTATCMQSMAAFLCMQTQNRVVLSGVVLQVPELGCPWLQSEFLAWKQVMKVFVFWLINSCGFLWKWPFLYFIDTKMKAWPLLSSKNNELTVTHHIALTFLKQNSRSRSIIPGTACWLCWDLGKLGSSNWDKPAKSRCWGCSGTAYICVVPSTLLAAWSRVYFTLLRAQWGGKSFQDCSRWLRPGWACSDTGSVCAQTAIDRGGTDADSRGRAGQQHPWLGTVQGTISPREKWAKRKAFV